MHPVNRRPATQYVRSQTVTTCRGCECSVMREGPREVVFLIEQPIPHTGLNVTMQPRRGKPSLAQGCTLAALPSFSFQTGSHMLA